MEVQITRIPRRWLEVALVEEIRRNPLSVADGRCYFRQRPGGPPYAELIVDLPGLWHCHTFPWWRLN